MRFQLVTLSLAKTDPGHNTTDTSSIMSSHRHLLTERSLWIDHPTHTPVPIDTLLVTKGGAFPEGNPVAIASDDTSEKAKGKSMGGYSKAPLDHLRWRSHSVANLLVVPVHAQPLFSRSACCNVL